MVNICFFLASGKKIREGPHLTGKFVLSDLNSIRWSSLGRKVTFEVFFKSKDSSYGGGGLECQISILVVPLVVVLSC